VRTTQLLDLGRTISFTLIVARPITALALLCIGISARGADRDDNCRPAGRTTPQNSGQDTIALTKWSRSRCGSLQVGVRALSVDHQLYWELCRRNVSEGTVDRIPRSPPDITVSCPEKPPKPISGLPPGVLGERLEIPVESHGPPTDEKEVYLDPGEVFITRGRFDVEGVHSLATAPPGRYSIELKCGIKGCCGHKVTFEIPDALREQRKPTAGGKRSFRSGG
jgi:hypothetical protein